MKILLFKGNSRDVQLTNRVSSSETVLKIKMRNALMAFAMSSNGVTKIKLLKLLIINTT